MKPTTIMPPKKTPPKPKTEQDAAVALVLFAKNLDEILRWYRGATYAGREFGHVVQTELVLSNVTLALSMALEGKSWQAPAHAP